MSNKIKDAILNELEVPMNQIAERIINQEKALFLKKTGKEMIISKWAEEMIRLSLVIDLMKTLQNYVKPTDELENMKWCEGGKGIEISANILREGVSYNFFTEAIYAGGITSNVFTSDTSLKQRCHESLVIWLKNTKRSTKTLIRLRN